MAKKYGSYFVEYSIFKNGKVNVKSATFHNVYVGGNTTFEEIQKRIALLEKINIAYIGKFTYSCKKFYNKRIIESISL